MNSLVQTVEATRGYPAKWGFLIDVAVVNVIVVSVVVDVAVGGIVVVVVAAVGIFYEIAIAATAVDDVAVYIFSVVVMISDAVVVVNTASVFL